LFRDDSGVLPPSFSLFKTDFEKVRVVAKGSFGIVLEARNKLDERLYAVKKIPIVLSALEEKNQRVDSSIYKVSIQSNPIRLQSWPVLIVI
jgi:serine/threonine protein kinase